MIKADGLSRFASIRHGFLGSGGGVSEGAFGSLNCGFGSGDDLDRVAENRRRALGHIGAPDTALVSARQQHTNIAITVTEPWQPGAAPIADAMATREPGIALGILSADCAPVLMADGDAGVIGAAHAGWRGALDGITDALIAAMIDLGAEAQNISAAVGPCIAQASYEVGPEFRERFVAADAGNEILFAKGPKPGHDLFDLPGYLTLRLQARSLGFVATLGVDTYPDDSGYFSYRRCCHQGQSQYGRALSVITLAGETSP
ncbi:MAG: laccase domain-containing protein [Rhodospirillaceae bacterium]|jgi:polyphenol oxidase|nr:laccase domain-containing protein [Rhodospirillaceae bacterium]MBT5179931.1 laccase domain-containing protein [Rhodospirillaceae bacterium]MBT6292053.1 laccase domain-containing protein [Rhodospirillaceae bacterium]